MTEKIYILVRTDRKFSIGKLMAHSAHAAFGIAMKYSRDLRVVEYFNKHQTKIILAVEDDEEVLKWFLIARETGHFAYYIADSGFKETDPETLICCAIGPLTEFQAKRLGLKSLKLFRG